MPLNSSGCSGSQMSNVWMNRQWKLTDATRRDTIEASGKERMFSHGDRPEDRQAGGGMAAAQVACMKATDGLNAFQRAYLDTLTTLAAWRVAQDCEAQVAHWAIEGDASHDDLLDARARTKKAHRAHSSARERYRRLSSLVAVQAGARAAAAYLGTR